MKPCRLGGFLLNSDGSGIGNVLEDDELNRRISPYYHAQEIKAPLLIFHGVNDPLVNIKESNQMVNIMRKNGKEVVYVVYPDEGHFIGLGHLQNTLDHMGRIEEFLAKHLGGRAEPFQKIPGSSAERREFIFQFSNLGTGQF